MPSRNSSIRECTFVPLAAAASLPPGFFFAHLSSAALFPPVAERIVVTDGRAP